MGKSTGTKLEQFDAYVPMEKVSSNVPSSTTKSDSEIEEFSQKWCKTHPVWVVSGPNCQTFTEDLFTFATGHNLPFKKTIDLAGHGGPENHDNCVWLNDAKKLLV